MATATKPPRKPRGEKKPKAGKQLPLVEDAFPDIPDEVTETTEEYVKTLRMRMKVQQKENTLRTKLLEQMHAHQIDRIPHPDDDQKYLALEQGEKIVTKRRKKTQSDAGEE